MFRTRRRRTSIKSRSKSKKKLPIEVCRGIEQEWRSLRAEEKRKIVAHKLEEVKARREKGEFKELNIRFGIDIIKRNRRPIRRIIRYGKPKKMWINFTLSHDIDENKLTLSELRDMDKIKEKDDGLVLPKKLGGSNMKIICVMAVYKRPEITLATIELLKKQTYPLDRIIIVGSCDLDRTVAEKACVEYLHHKNMPLGDKWQHGIAYARKYEPDAILINGSDSWLTTNWCEKTKPFIDKGFHLVGKTKWYSCRVDPNKKLFIVHRAYKSRKDPVGAGRLFSKEILDKMDWKLFPRGIRSSLDGHSYKNMLTKTTVDKVKLLNNIEDAFMMDVKSSTWPTMNPFNFIMSHTQFKDAGAVKNPTNWVEEVFPGSIAFFKTIVPKVII